MKEKSVVSRSADNIAADMDVVYRVTSEDLEDEI